MVAAFVLVFIAIQLFFIASQLFWVRRLRELGGKLITNKFWRGALGVAGIAIYLLLLAYNMAGIRHRSQGTELTLRAVLLEAPFGWWLLGSVFGFALAIIFRTIDRAVRAGRWVYRLIAGVQQPVPLQERRRFFEQTATALSAAPFVAGAYGLLYGRVNLETTRQRIKLARLPKAFEGLRIAQLSDIHIGPFMSGEAIRKFVSITNELKPDLVVLTGDYLTWDPTTQQAAVEALARLKAPFGVFGCLGNHERWTDTEISITRLFADKGIRILRQESVPIQMSGERLNLIGVDFQGRHGPPLRLSPPGPPRYLQGVERLIAPDTVNILLSHNPNSFDRAAELGIDLSLAGHTHGGQVTLEFIHPSLSPSRLITSYVQGWFEKAGAQLYVNRGIGTIGLPIRLDAPPEITLFELVRA